MRIIPKNECVKNMVDGQNTGYIKCDELYQRDAGQWTNEQNSLLIESTLKERIIPHIYTVENDDKELSIIDGRQRMNAFTMFLNDKFKLDKDLDPITYKKVDENGVEYEYSEEIAGKKFSQLSKKLQDRICRYSLNILIIVEYTDEEIEEQFYCLNNGSLFTKQQKATVQLGAKLIEKLLPITQHEFWNRSGLSKTQKKHGVVMETVLKTLMLLTDYDYGTNFGAKQVMQFAEYYSNNYKQEDIDLCLTLFDRLNSVIPDEDEYNNFLKPLNIPNLIIAVKDYLDPKYRIHYGMTVNDIEINDEFFGAYLTEFISCIDETPYGRYCGQGSTNKTKVEGRQKVLRDDWDTCCFILFRNEEGTYFDEHGNLLELGEDGEPITPISPWDIINPEKDGLLTDFVDTSAKENISKSEETPISNTAEQTVPTSTPRPQIDGLIDLEHIDEWQKKHTEEILRKAHAEEHENQIGKLLSEYDRLTGGIPQGNPDYNDDCSDD